jgi:hypothetical protein
MFFTNQWRYMYLNYEVDFKFVTLVEAKRKIYKAKATGQQLSGFQNK